MGKLNHNRRLEVRLTEAEMQRLNKMCGVRDRSDFVRDRIFRTVPGRPRKVIHSVDPRLIWQVRKIGVNLNQLAKQINTVAKAGDEIEVVLVYTALCSFHSALSRLLHDR